MIMMIMLAAADDYTLRQYHCGTGYQGQPFRFAGQAAIAVSVVWMSILL
jgi:hypothetical protein